MDILELQSFADTILAALRQQREFKSLLLLYLTCSPTRGWALAIADPAAQGKKQINTVDEFPLEFVKRTREQGCLIAANVDCRVVQPQSQIGMKMTLPFSEGKVLDGETFYGSQKDILHLLDDSFTSVKTCLHDEAWENGWKGRESIDSDIFF